MIIYNADLASYSRAKRLNIVNSLSGTKQACLIGSQSNNGITNLGIFNSVMHIGSDPALLGFMLRPHTEVRRDTFENIKETGVYTINHVHQNILVNSHYTSAKIEENKSEFERCGLTAEHLDGFAAPFVLESFIKIGLKFVERVEIKHNKTSIIIGEIQTIQIPDEVLETNGYLNLEIARNVAVSGLNRYYSVNHIMDLPYARNNEIPKF
ncbi:MAG: flavin reductase (DIM6/NTAB) family NADH-FMN oxidoreductase RutF [Salibacteraceae bacterium]|jgi:flavin reductase (DIM6/NTAB) family NADH-FMN oxidoreductase RutF